MLEETIVPILQTGKLKLMDQITPQEHRDRIPAYNPGFASGVSRVEHVRDHRLENSRIRNTLWEIQQRKLIEFTRNVGVFLGCLFSAIGFGYLFVSVVGFLWYGTTPTVTDSVVRMSLPFVAFLAVILTAIHAIILFFPLLFMVWGNVKHARQRKLLSMILAGLETKTPLGPMIRAHAMTSLSPLYRGKLIMFADWLDRGFSIRQALRYVPGIVRYDIATILEIDADNRATFETIESLLEREQDLASVQMNTSLRLAYLTLVSLGFIGISMILGEFVLPRFGFIFDDFDMGLPILTATVFHFFPLVLLFTIFVFFLMFPFLAIYFLVQIGLISVRPLGMRRLFRNVDSARLLRVLASGLRRKHPITETLDIYSRALRSAFLARQVRNMEQRIDAGQAWIPVFRKEGVLNAEDAHVLQAAQGAGNLAEMLDDISTTKDRMQLLECDFVSQCFFFPWILFLTFLIGLVVVGCFQPIVRLILNMA